MAPSGSGNNLLLVTGPITNLTGGFSSRNGRVRFSGGGNYSGLTISAGVVSIGANNGVCTNASVTIATSAAGTFDLNGFNQVFAGLAAGSFSALVTNSAASPSTLTLNVITPSTYSGVLAGSLNLIVNGSSVQTLSGANTYTGSTTVNGGTLDISQPTLAANSTVTVASGAVLQLDFATTNQVAALVLDGVSQPAGVYNATTSSPFLAGAGSILVASSIASNPTNITFSVSGGNLTLSWPADHLGWILQAQTNGLNTGLTTNWFDVANSVSTTQAVIPVNSASPSVFYRLRHP